MTTRRVRGTTAGTTSDNGIDVAVGAGAKYQSATIRCRQLRCDCVANETKDSISAVAAADSADNVQSASSHLTSFFANILINVYCTEREREACLTT